MTEEPDGSASEDVATEAGALVRLGLKVALGKRGEYVAEYLDDRRIKRIARRLSIVGDAAAESGLSADELVERIEADDDAAELLDGVIEAARAARYEPKLKYLGRCLATALTSHDDATLDTTWMKIGAVRDLDSVHVRLLHSVKAAQDRIAAASPRLEIMRDHSLPSAGEAALVEDRARGRAGMPASTFHAVMAVLLRNGLVTSEQDIDVEIDIDLDIEGESAEGTPTAQSSARYRVTGLGMEVLEEVLAADDAD